MISRLIDLSIIWYFYINDMPLTPHTLRLWRQDAERLVRRWIRYNVVNTNCLRQLIRKFEGEPMLNQEVQPPSGNFISDLAFSSELVAEDVQRSRELYSMLKRIAVRTLMRR